jgi:CMP-N-acetylneuraminic acid synthetase
MYKGVKVVAIIPARKGSKGIKNKNILDLLGLPLIAHSILQAKNSAYIDKVIVSTDSEQIMTIAQEHNVSMKGLRPTELASDSSILYDVIKYEILNHQLIKDGYELMVLLQPTSPLRQTSMIDDAIAKFVDENQESAVSVSEVTEHPVFMRTINGGMLKKVLDIDSTVRRQDLPEYYRVNGMIYINKVADIVNGYVSFNDNISPIIIPREFVNDIDSIEDFKDIEERMKKINIDYI